MIIRSPLTGSTSMKSKDSSISFCLLVAGSVSRSGCDRLVPLGRPLQALGYGICKKDISEGAQSDVNVCSGADIESMETTYRHFVAFSMQLDELSKYDEVEPDSSSSSICKSDKEATFD